MRYALTGFGLFAVMITLIVWAARPEMIKTAIAEISAPYTKYKEEKTKAAWETGYNQERAQWMLKNALPGECNAPRTAVEEVQCNELSRERERKFAQVWRINVKTGWKPDGVEN